MFVTAVSSQMAVPSPQQQCFGGKNIYVTFRSQSFTCPSISPAPDSQGVRQGGSGAH